MTEKDSRHGLNRLAEVPDKRNPRGKRHPLSAILGLSVGCHDVWISPL